MERFKIDLNTITKNDILDINEFIKSHKNMELVVRLRNTVGIKSNMLLSITDYPNLSFRVAGGFDDEREIRTNNKEYYEGKNFYTRNELINIITVFELIEKELMDKELNELDKVYFIYNKLKKYIKYDVDSLFSNKSNDLKGIITRKATSIGFSTIFKELLDRIGIHSVFVEGNKGRYAWIIVLINNKVVCLDLTYDSYLYHYGDEAKSSFFGNYNPNIFNKEHIPLKSEVIQDYNKDISLFDKIELLNVDKFIKNNKIVANRFVRNDNTSFLLSGIEIIKVNNTILYKYLYCDYLTGGRILNPHIIISENNFFKNEKRKNQISEEIKNIEGINNPNNSFKQNESNLKNEYNILKREDDYIINDFLSSKHIESIKNSYIGSFSFNRYEFNNNFNSALENINSDVRKYRRDDGSIFILEKYLNKNNSFYYHLYEFEQNNNESLLIESNSIILDNDILSINQKYDKYVSNVFFLKKRIFKAIREYDGYMGFCNVEDRIIKKEVINNRVEE